MTKFKHVVQSEIDIYKKLIDDCNIIFDIGISLESYIVETNYSKEKKYILFEPRKDKYNIIKEKYKDRNNVIIEKYALSNKEGLSKIDLKTGSMVEKRMKDGLRQLVKLITLDNYCIKNNISYIDYLKIDVEGFEDKIIRGSINILEKTKYIMLEMHGENILELNELFKKYNIYIYKNKFEKIDKIIKNYKYYLITKKSLENKFKNKFPERGFNIMDPVSIKQKICDGINLKRKKKYLGCKNLCEAYITRMDSETAEWYCSKCHTSYNMTEEEYNILKRQLDMQVQQLREQQLNAG